MSFGLFARIYASWYADAQGSLSRCHVWSVSEPGLTKAFPPFVLLMGTAVRLQVTGQVLLKFEVVSVKVTVVGIKGFKDALMDTLDPYVK